MAAETKTPRSKRSKEYQVRMGCMFFENFSNMLLCSAESVLLVLLLPQLY